MKTALFIIMLIGWNFDAIVAAAAPDVQKLQNIVWLHTTDSDFEFYEQVENELKKIATLSCEKSFCSNHWYTRYYPDEYNERCQTIDRLTVTVINVKAFKRVQDGLDLEAFCAQAKKLAKKK